MSGAHDGELLTVGVTDLRDMTGNVVDLTLNIGVLVGDANEDGRINSDDYFRIDSAFLAQPADPSYRDGDFNYDNRINSDDYFQIDSAFLRRQETSAEGPTRVAMLFTQPMSQPTVSTESNPTRTVRPLRSFSDIFVEDELETISRRRSTAKAAARSRS